MKKNYHPVDTNIRNNLIPVEFSTILKTGLTTLFLALTISNAAQAQSVLLPYKASYTVDHSGLSATLNRQFKKNGNGQWSLSNDSTLLFTHFIEKAAFNLQNNRPQPSTYYFKNPLNSKRNSNLRFDWEKGTVTETAKSNKSLKLPVDALDKLTFQIQLRLDLLEQGKNFKDKSYTLVEGNRLKQYNISYVGEELLKTDSGTFTAVKIKQQRPGKEKYTMIWLAKNWQYLILQIERFEKGESSYKLEFESATVNNKKMIAKAQSNNPA